MSEHDIKKDTWIKELVTKQQRNNLVQGLDRLCEVLYQTDQSWEVKLNQCLSENQRDLLIKLLQEQEIKFDDLNSIEKALIQMKIYALNLPILTLYLAIDLPIKHLFGIANWFEFNIGERVLLDICVDELLLGGAVIYYQGVRRDFSLRSKYMYYMNQGLIDIDTLLN